MRRRYPRERDYPKLIPVRNAQYHVAFADRLINGDLGGCCPDMKLISISRDQTPKEMYATFWHEVFHAFEFEWGLKLGHPRITKLEWLVADVAMHFQLEDVLKRPKP